MGAFGENSVHNAPPTPSSASPKSCWVNLIGLKINIIFHQLRKDPINCAYLCLIILLAIVRLAVLCLHLDWASWSVLSVVGDVREVLNVF